jgi:hypothetical protein
MQEIFAGRQLASRCALDCFDWVVQVLQRNALSDSEKRNLRFLRANAAHHVLNNRLHLICRERK